ncbi:MAG: RNA 2',3'-cyclic phosphodiesterase [Candidatus Eremiobacteraeota bacterium]|nr:RNA 2',3'-cyclic phosphodiesterase [Candidatus Eremiobacteraeota bacterium]
MKLRLFVAVEIDETVRSLARRAAESLADAGVVGRFELPEKMHVTVAFLGSVQQSDLPAVIEALREATAACDSFCLEFARLGGFPNARRPRVLWIGPAQESAAFVDCAARVREGYERLGFRFEHDASPHITLCRPKFVPKQPLPELGARATLKVEGLTLFQSLPAGQTTRYEALERRKLGRP